MFFRKNGPVDSLNRDLARARNKRDALASSVTTLTAQIAQLEVRLSAETIVGVKNRVRDRYLALAPAIDRVRDATEAAAAFVPEAHEVSESLDVTANEVAKAINGLLRDLDQRIEVVRAGNAAPELTQSLIRYLAAPQNGDPARIASTG
jgi:septal ring factor EnvC (AmiA/AmiB activator)